MFEFRRLLFETSWFVLVIASDRDCDCERDCDRDASFRPSSYLCPRVHTWYVTSPGRVCDKKRDYYCLLYGNWDWDWERLFATTRMLQFHMMSRTPLKTARNACDRPPLLLASSPAPWWTGTRCLRGTTEYPQRFLANRRRAQSAAPPRTLG